LTFKALRIGSVLWLRSPVEAVDRVQVRRKCTWRVQLSHDIPAVCCRRPSSWRSEHCPARRYSSVGRSD